MRTKRVYGFVTLATAFVIAACSGNNQATTVYTSDGGTVEDTGTTKPPPAADTGTGFNTPDTGSTFIDTGTGGTPDTGVVGTPDSDIVPPSDGGGGGVCPSTCTTDSECQAACPAQAGALNCCDTVTSACFTSASSSCPDQMSTGGNDSGGGGGY